MTKNRKGREDIAAMVRRSFDGMALSTDEDAITEITEGWFNAVYSVRLADGRETILKIAPPRTVEVLTYEERLMETEVAAMKLVAAKTDMPVPAVLYYDDRRDLCDSDYFFMEKSVGDNYHSVKKRLAPDTISAIDRQIGSYLRQMNGIRQPSYFGYDGNPALRGGTWREAFLKIIAAVLEDGEKKRADLGVPYDAVYALMERHAHHLNAAPAPHLVHWDCWDPNVIVQDGTVVGILDFERVLWADPLMESLFRTRNPEQLAGYGKTQFSPDEEVRCTLYAAYLHLVMRIECEYRHYDDDSTRISSRQALGETLRWLREHD